MGLNKTIFVSIYFANGKSMKCDFT